MKVEQVELFAVGRDRPWLFTAVRTADGITGYGEFGNGTLARGLPALVEDLAQAFVIGRDSADLDLGVSALPQICGDLACLADLR